MSLDLLKRVVRGSALYHRVRVLNTRVSPARPYDPDGGVRITYYQPDGTVHPDVNNVVMSKVPGILGEYEFDYSSVEGDPLGTWAVSANSTHQSRVTKDPKRERCPGGCNAQIFLLSWSLVW